MSLSTSRNRPSIRDRPLTDPERVLVDSVDLALHSFHQIDDDDQSMMAVEKLWLPRSEWIKRNQDLLRPGFLRMLIEWVKDHVRNQKVTAEIDAIGNAKLHVADDIIASLNKIKQENEPRTVIHGNTFDALPKATRRFIEPAGLRSGVWSHDDDDDDDIYMQSISLDTGEDASSRELEELVNHHIHDREKVVEFLTSRWNSLLQVAAKKIAKAWIKAICRKKQGIFPYQNKQRERSTGEPVEIPKWWPPVTECEFVEPDHVTKSQRISLLLHLLRLRPAATELRQWNKGLTDINHVHVSEGWTAFLRSVAPIEIVDDLEPHRKERVASRKRLLREIYEIAAKEEEYLNGRAGHIDTSSREPGLDGNQKKLITAHKKRRGSSSLIRENRASSVPFVQHGNKRTRPGTEDVSGWEMKHGSTYDVRGMERRDSCGDSNTERETLEYTSKGETIGISIEATADNGADGPASLQSFQEGNIPMRQQPRASELAAVDSTGSLAQASLSTSFNSDLLSINDGKQNPTQASPKGILQFQGHRSVQTGPDGDSVLVNYMIYETQPQFDAAPGVSFLPAAAMEHFPIYGPQESSYLPNNIFVNSPSTGLVDGAIPVASQGAGACAQTSNVGLLTGSNSQFVTQVQTIPALVFSADPALACEPYSHVRPSALAYHPSHKHPDRHETYNYYQVGPQQESNPEALPGAVTRGFTGHGSGVGGGAWI